MEDVPSSFTNNKSTSTPKLVSMDRKSKFSERIFRLNGMELGHLVQVIELKCPKALEDVDGNTPQVEINVDALPNSVFLELEAYLQEKVPNKKRKMN